MIYLDNSATTYFKPRIVKASVIDAVNNYTGNAGRSGHKIALASGEKVMQTRQTVADFFDASFDRVVFTLNCTTALNMAILGSVEKGMHVITTTMEHNSVLRPLNRLQENGDIELTIVSMNTDGCVSVDDIKSVVKPNTKLVVITQTSNVTGASNDVKAIGEFCHQNGIKIIVDCAQSAGHKKISMRTDNIDIICFAGHKGLYALTGIGGMVLADDVHLRPVILGGTGVDSISLKQEELFPDNFESGTLPVMQIISLGAGVEYVNKNFEYINNRIQNLTKYALNRLKYLNNIKIYSNIDNCSGVISFNLNNCDCNDVANFLDKKYNIAVRSGLHCAPLIHKQLGTIEQGGAIRISLTHQNNANEIDRLIDALIDYQNNN